MREFCKDIAMNDDEYMKKRYDGGDFIFKDKNGFGALIDTGDSGCVGYIKINYCPMCGRKVCDETETPIEHFLKSEMERSKLQMNTYAECFDGVHVDNDTRKKLLESHIRFCKNALKQCMDV